VNIICISPAPFDYPIWTNRQHIPIRFAKKHRVIYVFHPYLLRSSIKRNIFYNRKKTKNKNCNRNIHLYTPWIIPFSSHNLTIHRINVKISCFFLKKVLKKLDFHEYIIWFYDPEGVYYLNELNPILICYDCVDEYPTMPDYKTKNRKNRIIDLERKLIKKCNIVFTTSYNLFKKKRELNNNTFLVENVGDYDHFSKAQLKMLNTSSDFPQMPKPIIGFVGALDTYKVDFELIEFLSDQRPEWSFVFIGDMQGGADGKKEVPQKQNIYYLGRKKYKNLPEYVAHFDVCIIPYKINDYTRHVFPIKLYEFLSAGKPIVATELPSIQKLQDIIIIAKSYEAFLLGIEEAIQQDSEKLIQNRIEIAKQNTWETRVNKLLSYVESNIALAAAYKCMKMGGIEM